MAKVFANSGDTAASDLCLHCLPITLFGSLDKNGLHFGMSEMPSHNDPTVPFCGEIIETFDSQKKHL